MGYDVSKKIIRAYFDRTFFLECNDRSRAIVYIKATLPMLPHCLKWKIFVVDNVVSDILFSH